MKPVTLRGIFDHDKEIMVSKVQRGEKGVEIITPFYTHLDGQERPCAIMVNRGWVPFDLKDFRQHHTVTKGPIKGVLYRGDAQTKWSTQNSPTIEQYDHVYPSDFAKVGQLPNWQEAGQFMLH